MEQRSAQRACGCLVPVADSQGTLKRTGDRPGNKEQSWGLLLTHPQGSLCTSPDLFPPSLLILTTQSRSSHQGEGN